jgi:hypothetical protein
MYPYWISTGERVRAFHEKKCDVEPSAGTLFHVAGPVREPELGPPVLELVGEMVVIKDVPFPDERLVRHEVFHMEINSELVL